MNQRDESKKKTNGASDFFCRPNGRNGRGEDTVFFAFAGTEEKTGEKSVFLAAYTLQNPVIGGGKPVFGQTEENDGRRKKGAKDLDLSPSYFAVTFAAVGLREEDGAVTRRFFSWRDTQAVFSPFSVRAYDCYAGKTRFCGKISHTAEEAFFAPEWMCDGAEAAWDVRAELPDGFPGESCEAEIGVSGRVRFNGKTYEVDTSKRGLCGYRRGCPMTGREKNGFFIGLTVSGAFLREVPGNGDGETVWQDVTFTATEDDTTVLRSENAEGLSCPPLVLRRVAGTYATRDGKTEDLLGILAVE